MYEIYDAFKTLTKFNRSVRQKDIEYYGVQSECKREKRNYIWIDKKMTIDRDREKQISRWENKKKSFLFDFVYYIRIENAWM